MTILMTILMAILLTILVIILMAIRMTLLMAILIRNMMTTTIPCIEGGPSCKKIAGVDDNTDDNADKNTGDNTDDNTDENINGNADDNDTLHRRRATPLKSCCLVRKDVVNTERPESFRHLMILLSDKDNFFVALFLVLLHAFFGI